jgi:hypothetical protein
MLPGAPGEGSGTNVLPRALTAQNGTPAPGTSIDRFWRSQFCAAVACVTWIEPPPAGSVITLFTPIRFWALIDAVAAVVRKRSGATRLCVIEQWLLSLASTRPTNASWGVWVPTAALSIVSVPVPWRCAMPACVPRSKLRAPRRCTWPPHTMTSAIAEGPVTVKLVFAPVKYRPQDRMRLHSFTSDRNTTLAICTEHVGGIAW